MMRVIIMIYTYLSLKTEKINSNKDSYRLSYTNFTKKLTTNMLYHLVNVPIVINSDSQPFFYGLHYFVLIPYEG